MELSSDPLDYLSPDESAAADERPLRRQLLEATTAVLRRRRRLRKVRLAGSWAACYAAGALAMYLWRDVARPLAEDQSPQAKVNPPDQQVDKHESHAPELISAPTPEPFALVREWEAFDGSKNRVALLFEAGDRYLAERNDTVSALRCYRQALDAASREELAVQPGDNWLVITLKQSRQKEQ